MLQRYVDAGVEDYNLLMEGNKSLLPEHNELCHRSDDMESKLAKVRSSAEEGIAGLEAKIRSVKDHNVDLASAGEKCLMDFESELIKDLVELCALYLRNV
jgi:hypothetical protein